VTAERPAPDPPPRRAAILLPMAAAVLAGAAARVWRLTRPGLTSDEAFSWRLTGYPLPDMLGRAALDVHPPLYYLVLSGWRALAGESLWALRGLSVLMGLLTVALVWALVQEADGLDGVSRFPAPGALLAVAAVSVHATQVLQSRNARMYALGTAVAVASAWALLRAMRADGKRAAWWALWGLLAAAAVATHYYLAFTVVAEAAWAAADTVARTRHRDRAGRLRGLALGAVVALTAFAPWAPAAWRQVGQVRADYWIPSPTAAGLADGLARWALGLDPGRAAPALALLAGASVIVCLRAGRAARFLAVLAASPWVLGLLVSALSGRPIVLERYMVFAQVFLLAAWSVAIARLRSAPARTIAAAALLAVLLASLALTVRAYPAETPALANAARFLKRQAGAEDLVVVESPRALNKLRYYARQAEGAGLDVRCALPERIPLGPHVSHVVSLAEGDSIAAGSEFAGGGDTVWIGRETTAPPAPAPAGWTITFARLFEGGEDTRFAPARW